jgi:phage/plasmid-like protein (TIGR03299 family)
MFAMAHEIEEHDGLVLHREAAWHGLGTIVEDAPTPREALVQAGLDWDVVQYPLLADAGEEKINVATHVGNYRRTKDGTPILLGVVGEGYRPIQNAAMADFCTALAEQGDVVRCETAGSIRNGRKVWFLLKGESFSVRKEDEVAPYILVSNGHDGATSFRATPTTVRVVCSNTLHMVIPQKEGKGGVQKVKQCAFVCHHTENIEKRIEEAKAVLGLYGHALDTTREVIDGLAAADVNNEKVKAFFLSCYVKDFEPIPANPKTHTEKNRVWQAQQAWGEYAQRFESEKGLAGTTLWNAFNAYTGWLQNDRTVNVKDAVTARDRRTESRLFGVDADRAHNALTVALSMAT